MKKILLMIYPTHGEAVKSFDNIYPFTKGVVASRKSDMIETAEQKIHFISIGHGYNDLNGFTYDEVFIDSRIDQSKPLSKKQTLGDLIRSRKR